MGIKSHPSIFITQKIQAEITSELLNSHKILTDVIPAPVIFLTPSQAEFEQKKISVHQFQSASYCKGVERACYQPVKVGPTERKSLIWFYKTTNYLT